MKTKANQSAAEKNITMVALADIQPSGFNPRKRFDEAALYELAESIKRQGVLQPITVRPVDGTDRYGIVFGERRYRASVIAGRDEIPAIVTELSDEEAEEMAITENLQRKDVTPVEEAAAYQRLIESGRGRNSRNRNRVVGRGSRGNGDYRELAAQGRDTRGGSRSLSTAYRERTPYRADLGATLRKERELHPHTAEIHRPYPRNCRPFGSGRADHQRGG